eukprot:265123_1
MGNELSDEHSLFCACGRVVSTGTTPNGNKYITCCRPCAVRKFRSANAERHDTHCNKRYEKFKMSFSEYKNSNNNSHSNSKQTEKYNEFSIAGDMKDDEKYKQFGDISFDKWKLYLKDIPQEYHTRTKEFYCSDLISGKGEFGQDILWIHGRPKSQSRNNYRYGAAMKDLGKTWYDATGVGIVYSLKNLGSFGKVIYEFIFWNPKRNKFVHCKLIGGAIEYVGSSMQGFSGSMLKRGYNHSQNQGWTPHCIIEQTGGKQNIDCNGYSALKIVLGFCDGYDMYELNCLDWKNKINESDLWKIESLYIKKYETLNGNKKINGKISCKLNIKESSGRNMERVKEINKASKVLKKSVANKEVLNLMKSGDDWYQCRLCWVSGELYVVTSKQITDLANSIV